MWFVESKRSTLVFIEKFDGFQYMMFFFFGFIFFSETRIHLELFAIYDIFITMYVRMECISSGQNGLRQVIARTRVNGWMENGLQWIDTDINQIFAFSIKQNFFCDFSRNLVYRYLGSNMDWDKKRRFPNYIWLMLGPK